MRMTKGNAQRSGLAPVEEAHGIYEHFDSLGWTGSWTRRQWNYNRVPSALKAAVYDRFKQGWSKSKSTESTDDNPDLQGLAGGRSTCVGLGHPFRHEDHPSRLIRLKTGRAHCSKSLCRITSRNQQKPRRQPVQAGKCTRVHRSAQKTEYEARDDKG